MQRHACPACGAEVHFDNTACLTCGAALGFDAGAMAMAAAPPDRACVNRAVIGCNWLVAPDVGPGGLCPACVLNRVVPDPGFAGNRDLWSASEAAKRLLVYGLRRLGLPHPSRAEAGVGGLAFDFLAEVAGPDGSVQPVLTGHDDGLITLNILEADAAERAQRQQSMAEPYRTLIGHLRHEVGHYYWNVLVRDAGLTPAFRAIFGDETQDYGAALARHYAAPRADWATAHVSQYASAHPWEDFAETFAHYLHMIDALDSAAAWRITPDGPLGQGAVSLPSDAYRESDVDRLVAAFVPLTVAINAVNRSMGQPDLYPFVLSPGVVDKLRFVARLVQGAQGRPGDLATA